MDSISAETLLALPPPVAIEMAMYLSLDEVIKLCQSNKALNEMLCQSEDFWRERYNQDFPEGLGYPFREKLTGESWRIYYNCRVNQFQGKLSYLYNNTAKEIAGTLNDPESLSLSELLSYESDEHIVDFGEWAFHPNIQRSRVIFLSNKRRVHVVDFNDLLIQPPFLKERNSEARSENASEKQIKMMLYGIESIKEYSETQFLMNVSGQSNKSITRVLACIYAEDLYDILYIIATQEEIIYLTTSLTVYSISSNKEIGLNEGRVPFVNNPDFVIKASKNYIWKGPQKIIIIGDSPGGLTVIGELNTHLNIKKVIQLDDKLFVFLLADGRIYKIDFTQENNSAQSIFSNGKDIAQEHDAGLKVIDHNGELYTFNDLDELLVSKEYFYQNVKPEAFVETNHDIPTIIDDHGRQFTIEPYSDIVGYHLNPTDWVPLYQYTHGRDTLSIDRNDGYKFDWDGFRVVVSNNTISENVMVDNFPSEYKGVDYQGQLKYVIVTENAASGVVSRGSNLLQNDGKIRLVDTAVRQI